MLCNEVNEIASTLKLNVKVWMDLTLEHINSTAHEHTGILINIYLGISIEYNNSRHLNT